MFSSPMIGLSQIFYNGGINPKGLLHCLFKIGKSNQTIEVENQGERWYVFHFQSHLPNFQPKNL